MFTHDHASCDQTDRQMDCVCGMLKRAEARIKMLERLAYDRLVEKNLPTWFHKP